jgi:predicted porin
LAALAATGASFAQVTLYGVADVAVGAIDKVVNAAPAIPFNAVTGVAASPAANVLGLSSNKFQAIASNVLNNGNSRFGLKGTEDLGGGLKANFNFEGGINIATGAGNTSGYGNGDAALGVNSGLVGGQLFSRAANVSLAGGFGSLTAGRQLTTSFYSVASWELTGTANYSVVANQFGFGGVAPRDSAAVKYDTPAMGGFNASAMFTLEGNGVYLDSAKAGKGKYDLSVGYGAGPMVASLAYNKVDAGVEGTVLGGSYNFGMVKVAASWNSLKDGSGNKLTEGYTLGASIPMGAFTFTADMAQDTISRATSSNDTNFLLEAKYALSKRTFIYGVYVMDGKGKQAEDVSGYALGLRHNF